MLAPLASDLFGRFSCYFLLLFFLFLFLFFTFGSFFCFFFLNLFNLSCAGGCHTIRAGSRVASALNMMWSMSVWILPVLPLPRCASPLPLRLQFLAHFLFVLIQLGLVWPVSVVFKLRITCQGKKMPTPVCCLTLTLTQTQTLTQMPTPVCWL